MERLRQRTLARCDRASPLKTLIHNAEGTRMISTHRLVAVVALLSTVALAGCGLIPGNNQGLSQQELEDTLNAQQLPPGTTQTDQSVKGTRDCPLSACGEQAFISVSRTYIIPLTPKAVIEYLAQRQDNPIPLAVWKTLTTFPSPDSSCAANHDVTAYTVTTKNEGTTELSLYINGSHTLADLGYYVVPCRLLIAQKS